MGDFRTCAATTLYLLLLASVARHVLPTGLGQCPTFGQLQDFDINKMVGKWYEVERSFYLMELSASCTELRVKLNNRGQLDIVIHTRNRWTGTHCITRGMGVMSHDGASSFRYRVHNRMPYVIGRLLPGAGQYSILATDYDHFALIWSCTGLSLAHSDRMWVLGRKREIDAQLRAYIYNLLNNFGMDADRLILSKNNDCPDYDKNNTRTD
ncbi:PREDICTED: apolipoprotein D-like [Papilio xuthus]|uniref:Apolipoprotein D n=1 Tax=Papilio xuthus TaxID=66420 RepID=A0A194Q3N9_PAPXU|nr:PREDICTED: apolipoprotein D-like [Papilio xuthus]KPJ00153.1 Apolipoprotein D [Papilio xuthus]